MLTIVSSLHELAISLFAEVNISSETSDLIAILGENVGHNMVLP